MGKQEEEAAPVSDAAVNDVVHARKSAAFWEGKFSKLSANESERCEDREWIASVDTCLQAMRAVLTPPSPDTRVRILVIGCGESMLSSGLYASGYHHIVSTDISEAAIAYQKARDASELRSSIEWVVDDCCMMKFGDSSFDFVVDKGTADTLLFRSRSKERCDLVNQCFKEIQRVLTPTGIYCCISPRKKFPWMKEIEWKVHTTSLKHKDSPNEGQSNTADVETAVKDSRASVSARVLPKSGARGNRETAYLHVCRKGSGKDQLGYEILTQLTVERQVHRHALLKAHSAGFSHERADAGLDAAPRLTVTQFWENLKVGVPQENGSSESKPSVWQGVVCGRIVRKRCAGKSLVFYVLVDEDAAAGDQTEQLQVVCDETGGWVGDAALEAGLSFSSLHKILNHDDVVEVHGVLRVSDASTVALRLRLVQLSSKKVI